MFCKKHPRYLAVRKQRAHHCGRCWWLHLLKRLHPGLKVGRPVVHRRRDAV
jgi:hypothetical protein